MLIENNTPLGGRAVVAGFRGDRTRTAVENDQREHWRLNEELVLEILISDRHPLPFVLALIEGRRTDIFSERVFVESQDERNCE